MSIELSKEVSNRQHPMLFSQSKHRLPKKVFPRNIANIEVSIFGKYLQISCLMNR